MIIEDNSTRENNNTKLQLIFRLLFENFFINQVRFAQTNYLRKLIERWESSHKEHSKDDLAFQAQLQTQLQQAQEARAAVAHPEFRVGDFQIKPEAFELTKKRLTEFHLSLLDLIEKAKQEKKIDEPCANNLKRKVKQAFSDESLRQLYVDINQALKDPNAAPLEPEEGTLPVIATRTFELQPSAPSLEESEKSMPSSYYHKPPAFNPAYVRPAPSAPDEDEEVVRNPGTLSRVISSIATRSLSLQAVSVVPREHLQNAVETASNKLVLKNFSQEELNSLEKLFPQASAMLVNRCPHYNNPFTLCPSCGGASSKYMGGDNDLANYFKLN